MKYAVTSALSFRLDSWQSRSHCPSDLVNRCSTMFSKPPIVVEPSRRAGSSSIMCQRILLKATQKSQRVMAHRLVGLKVVSELAMRIHCSRGTAWARYAMAARHCGSMDGNENAGPHIWSSRTIAVNSLQRKK